MVWQWGHHWALFLRIFLWGYHERKWLQSFEEHELILYRRHVDNIICLFNSKSDADKFFAFPNQLHPKIKLTIEMQTEN